MNYFTKTIYRALSLSLALAFAHNLYSVSYYYDEVGRLTQIAYESGSGIVYTYDDNDNMLSAETVFVPPQPPALTTVVTPNVGITLQWEAISGSTSYRIYRRSDRYQNWEIIANVSSDTFAFFDTRASAAVVYFYRLVAVGDDGLSAYSSSTPNVGIDGVAAIIQIAGENENRTIYSIIFEAELHGAYRLDSSESPGESDWSTQEYSLQIGGSTSTEVIRDVDGEILLYVSLPNDQSPLFFRLARLFE